MPIGKYVTEEEKARILRLLAQGLAPKVISIRISLSTDVVYKIRKQARAKEVVL